MSPDPLFRYYDRELRYFRELAAAYQARYPAMASSLELDPKTGSSDPMVQHLIEAFALIAARIHLKLDDEFPELTDALLGVLYPHFLAPIPSAAVVQFAPSPGRPSPPEGVTLERGLTLETVQKINGTACTYRTCYPVTLWPLDIDKESGITAPDAFGAIRPPPGVKHALRLRLRVQPGQNFAALRLKKLRFYLNGDRALASRLYELIFHGTRGVAFVPLEGDRDGALLLRPSECLSPVGFQREESLLPYPTHAFLGYRILTEFFAFPQKFLFFDVGGWERIDPTKFKSGVEILLFVEGVDEDLERNVRSSTFLLGCTPVVNLFPKTADAIKITQTQYSYPIFPDVTRQRDYEIFRIDSVYHLHPENQQRDQEYQPFFSFRHSGMRNPARAFWYATRRPSIHREDAGTDMVLSLVDLDFQPRLPAENVLTLDVTCSNRNLPAELRKAGEKLEMVLLSQAPALVRLPTPPTAPLRPPLRRGAYWRLVSHLSLNHLSLVSDQGAESANALREMLRLYDFSDPEVVQQQADVNTQMIEGVLAVTARSATHRSPLGFTRGTDIEITFDAEKYFGQGEGVYLFASVLECFLGLYTSINSSTRLLASTKQGRRYEPWPPRAGERPLL